LFFSCAFQGEEGDSLSEDQTPFEHEIWVCERNIRRFLQKLEKTEEEEDRAQLLQLLAREERQLLRLRGQPGLPKKDG
jgi:hypothetical protein